MLPGLPPGRGGEAGSGEPRMRPAQTLAEPGGFRRGRRKMAAAALDRLGEDPRG